MDLLADLIRELYAEHAASFPCPDPAGSMAGCARTWELASAARFAEACRQRFGVSPGRPLGT